jgi:hypothetical protein
MGKDMRGQRHSKRDYEILGRGSIIGREGLYFVVCDIVLVWEFGWTVTGVH